jgi:Rieske Fe-S protein
VADELGPPQGQEEHGAGGHHLPTPTIWPFAFAVGVALLLVGLIVSWTVVAVGAGIAVVFGFLWIREATREVRGAPPPPPPAPATEAPALEAEPVEEDTVSRRRFLEGATLAISGAIGGVVTVPIAWFAVAPAFVGQGDEDVDLGPLENYPEGKFVIATFLSDLEEGSVSRRTAYIRNNGFVEGLPSFTIVSNRCVHLGCPVQPAGPPGEPKEIQTKAGTVSLTPTQPSGFSCPCHGGAYDTEGNRTAGPPVRALDRYEFKIVEGNLVLAKLYSVGEVRGTGGDAVIVAYRHADPGVHVDGPEQILYPIVP